MIICSCRSFVHISKKADILHKSGVFTSPPNSDTMAFHFSSHCMIASLTWLTYSAGLGYMLHSENYSQCSSAVVRVEYGPSFYSTQSRHAPHDRRRFGISIHRHQYMSSLAMMHFALFASTNSSSSQDLPSVADSTRLSCMQQCRQVSVHS